MKLWFGKKDEEGFTMIEMMTTLMVAAILFCLSTPVIYYCLKKNAEDQAVKAVAAGLAQGRLRAIYQNSGHKVTFDNDKHGYSVVKNTEADKVLEQGSWSEDYSLTGTSSVQFDPMGRPDRTTSWELSSQERKVKYVITLDPSGRVQYEKQ